MSFITHCLSLSHSDFTVSHNLRPRRVFCTFFPSYICYYIKLLPAVFLVNARILLQPPNQSFVIFYSLLQLSCYRPGGTKWGSLNGITPYSRFLEFYVLPSPIIPDQGAILLLYFFTMLSYLAASGEFVVERRFFLWLFVSHQAAASAYSLYLSDSATCLK